MNYLKFYRIKIFNYPDPNTVNLYYRNYIKEKIKNFIDLMK